MRLLTYNIHGCVGMRLTSDPDATVAVIEEADADVVALQEVHDDDERDMSFLRALEQLGYANVIYGATMRNPRGHYGNVLMTRTPAHDIEHVDLGQSKREPRSAIRTRVEWNGIEVEIIATHLGLGPREREAQLELLLARCESGDADPGRIRVFMGDLNEWNPWSRSSRLIRDHFGGAPHPPTFPSFLPLLRLDRIHVLPGSIPCRLEAMNSRNATLASDHLPLLALVRPGG
ncbi:MAG: endonuclease/exonuclease/phosphatase family protein [Verrucomicrobiales bacterium]